MSFSDKLIDSFKGRLNRRNYLIGSVLLILFGYFEHIFLPRTFDAVYIALVASVKTLFTISISIRRAYDVGWSRTIIKLLTVWIFLDFITMLAIKTLVAFGLAPDKSLIKGVLGLTRIFVTNLPIFIASLVLLFKKGQDGPNEYGDPPSPNIRFPQDFRKLLICADTSKVSS